MPGLRRHPGRGLAFMLLGRVALVLGELDEAATYLTDAIAEFDRLVRCV